jgi:hypothetical protein
MNKYIEEVNLNNNINEVWENLKSSVIHKTATETLGERKKRLATREIKIWNTQHRK